MSEYPIQSKPFRCIRRERNGISLIGLMWVLCCLTLAGFLWIKADSMDAAVPVASAKSVQSVASSGGLHTKNIEDVKAGDRVWAYDPVHEKWEAKPVIKPLVHEYAGDMISISVAGQTIKCTGNHPFWVAGGADLFDREQARDVYPSDRASAVANGKGRWIEARKLQPGDLLVLRNGSQVPIEEVQVSYARQKVYNLQVADLHTYAVSDLGVAVHNKPCFPPGTLILMGDGSVKPIEQVELGDQVMAGDPLSTGPPHAAKVTGLIRDFTACLVDITFRTSVGTQATITPTRYHPFWTNNRGWVEAKDLRAGDLLQDGGRNSVAVIAVKLRPQFIRSYNFEVAGVHTYYALADDHTPVLVHNQVVPAPPGWYYHYTNQPESSFSNGFWEGASATDKLYTDPYLASQELGIPVPNKIIPIQANLGDFIPNSPPIVKPSYRFSGGGTDFTNPARIPASQIEPARPIPPTS
jgi:hypothetical protein